MSSTTSHSVVPGASCEDCVARLSAAAQETQFVLNHLHKITELLETITESVNDVTTASDLSPPLPLFTESKPRHDKQKRATREATNENVWTFFPGYSTFCVPTTAFWRAWCASTTADALFHRSGLSTSFSAFEKTVIEMTTRAFIPRVQQLCPKVRRLGDCAEDDSRQVLSELDGSAARDIWIKDAVRLLSQAARAPLNLVEQPSTENNRSASTIITQRQPDLLLSSCTLWSSLEADLKAAVATTVSFGGPNTISADVEKVICESRLRQQKQRIVQLIDEMINNFACDRSPGD